MVDSVQREAASPETELHTSARNIEPPANDLFEEPSAELHRLGSLGRKKRALFGVVRRIV